jgi:filamentous hemagglutinin family protein
MMKTKLWLSFLPLISLIPNTQTAQAQTYQPSNRPPVADSTLNTQVSANGSTFNITGGLTKGQTLFHSFTDFSVPTNGAANFVNLTNPRDIITRVTGNSFSDINGLVNTNGANFFLINPNGIVFGTNAQLNVGRAFMASTANGLNLVDGAGSAITFGTNTNGDPLLKIAPNVLFNVSSLTMGGGNGQISNFGTLQTTNPNQYIGLIGGNVNLNGGQIIAPGGRVDIGGLSAPGTVTFGVQRDAQLPTNVERGDVLLTNGARVDVTGAGGGDICHRKVKLNSSFTTLYYPLLPFTSHLHRSK